MDFAVIIFIIIINGNNSIIPNKISSYNEHFFEMNDNTILISAQDDLYILLYSQ